MKSHSLAGTQKFEVGYFRFRVPLIKNADWVYVIKLHFNYQKKDDGYHSFSVKM